MGFLAKNSIPSALRQQLLPELVLIIFSVRFKVAGPNEVRKEVLNDNASYLSLSMWYNCKVRNKNIEKHNIYIKIHTIEQRQKISNIKDILIRSSISLFLTTDYSDSIWEAHIFYYKYNNSLRRSSLYIH